MTLRERNGTGDGASGAIPGTAEFAGMLKDTIGEFRSGLGIVGPTSSMTCEGCGAVLSGPSRRTVRCEYCNRESRLP